MKKYSKRKAPIGVLAAHIGAFPGTIFAVFTYSYTTVKGTGPRASAAGRSAWLT